MTHAHLVGSVNLPDHETVFRSASAALGAELPRLSDGEVGRSFVTWFMPTLMQHPAVYAEQGDVMAVLPKVRIRQDYEEQVDFDSIGLGTAALDSYKLFSELKEQGVVAPETRFLVGVPSPYTLAVAVGVPEEQEQMCDALERLFQRELQTVLDGVPHDQLAIQVELPGEVGAAEGVFPSWFGQDPARMAERFGRLVSVVPDEVELGFHLCYGDPPPEEGKRGEHWADPVDMGVLVTLGNAMLEGAGRPIGWVHMPVPMKRDDPEYFQPLTGLKLPEGTELFLGLVHDLDGIEGSKRRVAAAQQSVASFGVATECGMGRVPAEQTLGLLQLHHDTAALVEGAAV